MSKKLRLLEGATVDGAGAWVPYTLPSRNAQLYGYDDFGGGTVQLQFSPDDGVTAIDVPDATVDGSESAIEFRETYGMLIRANLTGSTGASLTIEVASLEER